MIHSKKHSRSKKLFIIFFCRIWNQSPSSICRRFKNTIMMIGTEKENEFCVDWNNNNHNDAKRRELTKQHLMRMPYISNSRNQKMAVWTDIKEILFPSCDKNCEIVLEELKKTVNYPKHEKYMYPCSPRDHVSFLRQFRYVAIGTLLVQINKIDCNQVLWKRVLKRHISPENDDHFCCSPATKGKSSRTVKEEGAFTVLKFHKVFVDRKSKSVQSSQAFVIPAFVGEKNQSGTTSHFIPLYLLGNNVPNVRKHLVDFCGHHIVRSDNPYTHCCSVEEAREITIWQFNKFGGWGRFWVLMNWKLWFGQFNIRLVEPLDSTKYCPRHSAIVVSSGHINHNHNTLIPSQ